MQTVASLRQKIDTLVFTVSSRSERSASLYLVSNYIFCRSNKEFKEGAKSLSPFAQNVLLHSVYPLLRDSADSYKMTRAARAHVKNRTPIRKAAKSLGIHGRDVLYFWNQMSQVKKQAFRNKDYSGECDEGLSAEELSAVSTELYSYCSSLAKRKLRFLADLYPHIEVSDLTHDLLGHALRVVRSCEHFGSVAKILNWAKRGIDNFRKNMVRDLLRECRVPFSSSKEGCGLCPSCQGGKDTHCPHSSWSVESRIVDLDSLPPQDDKLGTRSLEDTVEYKSLVNSLYHTLGGKERTVLRAVVEGYYPRGYYPPGGSTSLRNLCAFVKVPLARFLRKVSRACSVP